MQVYTCIIHVYIHIYLHDIYIYTQTTVMITMVACKYTYPSYYGRIRRS